MTTENTHLNKLENSLNIILTGLLFLLLIGTPLIFTSLTRSVFEVNKLLLLRLVTIFTYGIWLFKYLLLRDNGKDNPKEESYSILGLRWEKIGLELPILFFIVANLLSTIFSENIRISIIGSYDRWEGIFTVINYAMLYLMYAKCIKTKKQFFLISSGIIIPAALSSVYGFFQSLGWDFMKWSVNPTARVFACINNPVHFCAYVAMVVPFAIGLLLYLSNSNTIVSKKSTAKNRWHITVLLTSLVIVNFDWWNVWTLLGLTSNYLLSFGEIFSLKPLLSILLIIGSFVAVKTPNIIPTSKDFAIWAGYALFIGILSNLGIIAFNSKIWTTFILMNSLYFIFSPAPLWINVAKRGAFALTMMLFYAQLLSFSRAAWVGSIWALTLFFIVASNLIRTKSQKSYLADICVIFISLALLYAFHIFSFYLSFSWQLNVIITTLLILFAYYNYVILKVSSLNPLTLLQESKTILKEKFGIITLFILTFSIAYFTKATYLTSASDNHLFSFLISNWDYIRLVSAVLATYLCIKKSDTHLKPFLSRLLIIAFFAEIQFMGASITNIAISITIFINLYSLFLRGNENLKKEQKFWILATLIGFSAVTIGPILPSHYLQLKGDQTTVGLKAVNNIKNKFTAYKRDANDGKSARVSMWRSSVPWIADYPVLGSGLDTIKYMYPIYRESVYGILEGGHNFTPDRLHNDYLNTLATKGILGFVSYYLFFVLGWYILTLKSSFKLMNSKFRFPLLGLVAGATVFFGQLLFNFGVVATLVLVYVFMGLAHALSYYGVFNETENEDESK